MSIGAGEVVSAGWGVLGVRDAAGDGKVETTLKLLG